MCGAKGWHLANKAQLLRASLMVASMNFVPFVLMVTDCRLPCETKVSLALKVSLLTTTSMRPRLALTGQMLAALAGQFAPIAGNSAAPAFHIAA